jgi:hypothetical protein
VICFLGLLFLLCAPRMLPGGCFVWVARSGFVYSSSTRMRRHVYSFGQGAGCLGRLWQLVAGPLFLSTFAPAPEYTSLPTRVPPSGGMSGGRYMWCGSMWLDLECAAHLGAVGECFLWCINCVLLFFLCVLPVCSLVGVWFMWRARGVYIPHPHECAATCIHLGRVLDAWFVRGRSRQLALFLFFMCSRSGTHIPPNSLPALAWYVTMEICVVGVLWRNLGCAAGLGVMGAFFLSILFWWAWMFVLPRASHA